MTRRRGWLAGGAILLALVAILALSRPTEDRYQRPRLDPRGTAPGGTAAFVELLESRGAEARIGGLPRQDDEVVVQLVDTLGGSAATGLHRWVRAGGTLVLADPGAALAPPRDDGAIPTPTVVGPGLDCEVEALSGLQPIQEIPAPFAVSDPSSSCFTATVDGLVTAAVDVRRRGDGLVVAVSSSLPFTNAVLDEADNAALVLALASAGAQTRIRVLDPNRTYGGDGEVGDGTILGALPRRGSQAVSQLVVAFLVWGLVTGRRLGKPVVEELPVPLPASDLVLASGRLLDRNGDVADAAERLRRRARRDLGVSIGLGADPPPAQLADALRTRAHLDAGLVHAGLLAPVTDESALVATASHLDRLRRDLSS